MDIVSRVQELLHLPLDNLRKELRLVELNIGVLERRLEVINNPELYREQYQEKLRVIRTDLENCTHDEQRFENVELLAKAYLKLVSELGNREAIEYWTQELDKLYIDLKVYQVAMEVWGTE